MSPRLKIPAQQKLKLKKSPINYHNKDISQAVAEKKIAEGYKLHKSGNLIEARKLYEDALKIQADNFSAFQLIGILLIQEGKNLESINFLDKAVQINPNFAPCYINRGIALHALKRFDEALVNYDKAINIQSDYPEAFSNRGLALAALKKFDHALVSYDLAIRARPNYADAYNNKGLTFLALKQKNEALASYQKAIEINPEYADPYLNRGNILLELNEYDQALANYNQAIRIKPNFAEAHYCKGNLLQELNKHEEALLSYELALKINISYADAFLNRGSALQKLKRYDEALHSYNQAIRIDSEYAKAYSNRGVVLKDLKRYDEALSSYDQSIKIQPDYAKVHSNRGGLLLILKRLDEALTSFEKVISIEPNEAQGYFDRGVVLNDKGLPSEAINSYRQALSLDPKYIEARNNILFVQSYTGICNPSAYLDEARKWEVETLNIDNRRSARERTFEKNLIAKKRLRVGYVSGDYYDHSISFFVEELFRHHDRNRVEIFAYTNNVNEDNKTKRLKTLVDYWVPIYDESDEDVRDRIEADQIDVLIDLSGYTAFNRMGVFARRAAPVQAHYLGYAASTGLTEMDYWIGDELLTPPALRDHFQEELWCLPRVWISYKPEILAPDPKWSANQAASICIGSFNEFAKLNSATISLWAKVLHAMPDAKLLLKTKKLGDLGNRQKIFDSFLKHRIISDRIELQDGSTTPAWSDHMAYYDRLDIALDPVGGVGGGTTTCDALWMGVPVITLMGETMGQRMTSTMLNAIGRHEWIAHTEAEYVDKVIELARNIEHRKNLRFTQRSRMAQSALCDSKGLATALEDAYESMFKKWYQKNNSVNQNTLK